jgi:outer membrane protein OmpA-like peptidoglycan-associated protein
MNFLFPNFFCLLLAALIGWLVGWLLGRSRKDRPAESLDVELAGKMRLCDEERSRLEHENADLKSKHASLRAQLEEASLNLSSARAGIGEQNTLREELEEAKSKLNLYKSNGGTEILRAELEGTKRRLAAYELAANDRETTITQLKNHVSELQWMKWSIKNIQFPVDSPELTPQAKAILEEVVPVLKRLTNVAVEIGGHTDNIDNDAHNLELSMKRANAVRSYLIARGVHAEMLTAVGYGASRPIAENTTDAGRQQNRRIEFVVKQ